MTTEHVIELDTLTFLALAAIGGVAFALYLNHQPKIPKITSLPVVQSFQNAFPSPTPTPTPVPKAITDSQVSPDGSKKITMKMMRNKDDSKSYTFTTAGTDDSNVQTIYSTTLSGSESLSIPFNTFSSDNAYVFLNKTSGASGSAALVMRANGQPMTTSDQYYNITDIFNARATGYTYQETTGWASETLLIVNTLRSDNTKGPSYWVEVPSKAVIQLSTQF